MKQLFRGKIQDFRAIFKQMTPKSPKNEVFFQMAKKTGLDFLNVFFGPKEYIQIDEK